MKSVLISISPKWCELIASKKKTIEVRKTEPKIDTPFKCYIYCTKGSPYLNSRSGKLYLESKDILGGKGCGEYRRLNGEVIGEFICDKISEAHWMQDIGYACVYKTWQDKEDCLTNNELLAYMGDKGILYGWHISQLKIYDEPKGLRNFYQECDFDCSACDCPHWMYMKVNADEYDFDCEYSHKKPIKRPPQSWCYAEELKGSKWCEIPYPKE